MTPRAGDTGRASSAVLAAVWLLGAFLVLVFAYQSWTYLRFPYDLDYCEGCVLTDAVNLFNGTGMYGPVQGVPAGVSIYPPLFQFLAGLLIKIFGPALAVTRGLSLVSTLALTALIAFIARRYTNSRSIPFLAAACFLASNFVYEWAPLGRIDMLAITLSAGAVYCVCGKFPVDWAGVYLSAGLSILAIYTKQTSLAAPAAIAGYLLWTDRRAAIKFILVCLAGGLAILAVIQQMTHGLFYYHIVTAAFTQVVSTRRAASLEWNFLRQNVFFFLLSASWALRAFFHRDNDGDGGRQRLLALWLVTSLGMTLTGGNQGSSVNYFIEAVACMSILAILEFDRLRQIHAGAIIPGLVLVQLILLVHIPYRQLGTEVLPYPPLGYTPRRQDIEVGKAIDRHIREARGPVLMEDTGYEVRNGKMPVVLNPIFLIMLQNHRQFDTQPILHSIAQGEYPFIILNWPGALPQDVLKAVDESYKEIEVLRPGGNRFAYRVYAPNNREKTQ